MTLTFRPSMWMDGPRGELVHETRCVEIPRLSILQQRQQHGRDLIITFVVDGIRDFGSIDAAFDFLRANPKPGDIVAIPPRETLQL